jgi:hypothetical protein
MLPRKLLRDRNLRLRRSFPVRLLARFGMPATPDEGSASRRILRLRKTRGVMSIDELGNLAQLRNLEREIDAQRQFVAALKSQNLDADGELERLGELLAALDRLLGHAMGRAA